MASMRMKQTLQNDLRTIFGLTWCLIFAMAILKENTRTIAPVTGFVFPTSTAARQQIGSKWFETRALHTISPKRLEDLESLTVKELKQILKENDLNKERGILTRLKRKQDLVDYLRQNLSEDEAKEEYIDNNSEGDDIFDQEDDDTDLVSPPVGIESAEGDFSIIGDEEENKNTQGGHNALEIAPSSLLELSPEIATHIPKVIQETMARRGIHSLLPIQQASFGRIHSGKDAILHSPTGSGKTLAFVLPLLASKKRRAWQRKKVASPRILTICPSRELAKQVGKEYSKLAGTAFGVVTVFGGVPLERHVALLKQKPQIVVATPGRLRELIREGHMDYSQVATLVLDEADLLLDKGDSPDVFAAIEDIEKALYESDEHDPEYQMVLVSATTGKNVMDFAKEMEFPKASLIRVDGIQDSKIPIGKQERVSKTSSTNGASTAATVGHWHMSCKSTVRPEITANLISVLSPRLTIIFVPTKSETESVASYLSERASGSTLRILHGDMSQSARSRCISMIREDASRFDESSHQILVATDVASRGLDLPNVDLVVQFGLPKIAGKDGTVNPELYAHRTGRTGRYRVAGSTKVPGVANRYDTANAVALYDPSIGEGKLLPALVDAVSDDLGVVIAPMAIPSSAKVVDSVYQRLSSNLVANIKAPMSNKDLASYFMTRLESDDRIDTEDVGALLQYLAKAMVELSKLHPSLNPSIPTSSLLTGDPKATTLRMFSKDYTGVVQDGVACLTPPIVTSFCKAHGSGKLGRVVICSDGSAVFDLPNNRAKRLLERIRAEDETSLHLKFGMEMPNTLPDN